MPAAAQRAVLYEEEKNDPQGKRYLASVVRHTVTVSPGSGVAPEIAVQADLEIPERHINITCKLRRALVQGARQPHNGNQIQSASRFPRRHCQRCPGS